MDNNPNVETFNQYHNGDKSGRYHWPRHHSNPGLAVILVILGGIFLLNNFNLLPWEIWSNIWRLWPLVLIIWGLQVLFGRSWLATFTVILVTMIVVFLLLSYLNPNLAPYFSHLFPTK